MVDIVHHPFTRMFIHKLDRLSLLGTNVDVTCLALPQVDVRPLGVTPTIDIPKTLCD